MSLSFQQRYGAFQSVQISSSNEFVGQLPATSEQGEGLGDMQPMVAGFHQRPLQIKSKGAKILGPNYQYLRLFETSVLVLPYSVYPIDLPEGIIEVIQSIFL